MLRIADVGSRSGRCACVATPDSKTGTGVSSVCTTFELSARCFIHSLVQRIDQLGAVRIHPHMVCRESSRLAGRRSIPAGSAEDGRRTCSRPPAPAGPAPPGPFSIGAAGFSAVTTVQPLGQAYFWQACSITSSEAGTYSNSSRMSSPSASARRGTGGTDARLRARRTPHAAVGATSAKGCRPMSLGSGPWFRRRRFRLGRRLLPRAGDLGREHEQLVLVHPLAFLPVTMRSSCSSQC